MEHSQWQAMEETDAVDLLLLACCGWERERVTLFVLTRIHAASKLRHRGKSDTQMKEFTPSQFLMWCYNWMCLTICLCMCMIHSRLKDKNALSMHFKFTLSIFYLFILFIKILYTLSSILIIHVFFICIIYSFHFYFCLCLYICKAH